MLPELFPLFVIEPAISREVLFFFQLRHGAPRNIQPN